MLCSMGFRREREELISKIKYCIGRIERNFVAREHGNFPLTDILFQLYKKALLESDPKQNDEVSLLIDIYKKENSDFDYSVEDLISKGWVETCFGHYHIIGHYTQKDQGDKRYEPADCIDADILKFISWSDDHSDLSSGKYWIKADDMVVMLDKWRNVCDSVPEIDWFCDNKYVVQNVDKVFLSMGEYSINITMAMARLWDYISAGDDIKSLSEKWFQIASQINLSPDVVWYVQDKYAHDNKERLLQNIVSAVENDSKYVAFAAECNKNINAVILDCY